MPGLRSKRRVYSWMMLGALAAGCQEEQKKEITRPPGTMGSLASFSGEDSPAGLAMKGTVGEVTYLQGGRMMAIRGYGLVTRLEGQGSRNCPPSVRDYILRELRRARSIAGDEATYTLTAEQLLESRDTAVVEVYGEVPSGAVKGQVFDVFVRAMDEDTRSIAGGYLLPCELNIDEGDSPAEVIEGRSHAKARGLVFVNPFADSGDGPSTVNMREGRVLGGAVNTQARRLNLVTVLESYSTVQRVAAAINRRLGTNPDVAEASGPTLVELQVPGAFQGREKRFIELITHLTLSESPAHREARAKVLVGELGRSDAAWEDVASSLEGLGAFVIPMVQPLYTDSRRQVNYYAAQTGLRLGDELAIEVVIRHAHDPRSPYRLRAISELGEGEARPRAAAALRDLLRDEDVRIRVRAYEALRRVDEASIIRVVSGPTLGNFILELLPSEGPPVIYARRTGTRRLAMIGADRITLRPPLLYAESDAPVTLSARDGDRDVTVLRKDKGKVVGEFHVPFSAAVLARFMGDDPRKGNAGNPRGLGLDYTVVLKVLYRLREMGAIDADLQWEEPSVEDLFGPLSPTGRPESEL